MLLLNISGFAQIKGINPTLDTVRIIQGRIYDKYSVKPYTGNSIKYYTNGKKQFEVPYIDGFPEGRYREWYDNGNLKLEGTYNAGGIENGKFTRWFKNSKIAMEGYFLNGSFDSVWTFYSIRGYLLKKAIYKDGVKEGIWEYWTRGILYEIEEYKNDILIRRQKIADYEPIEEVEEED